MVLPLRKGVAVMGWPQGMIPYTIDPTLSAEMSLIHKAMNHLNQHTCVKFIPRSNQTNYIHFFAGEGCFSYLGYHVDAGDHLVSVGRGCGTLGSISHLLGHVLGFGHEHQRKDRDNYLLIHAQNIQEGMAELFEKRQEVNDMPFDLNSIMMYGDTLYSKDGASKTLEVQGGVAGRLYEVWEKGVPSPTDLYNINQLYSC
jgi:hypothetical protein